MGGDKVPTGGEPPLSTLLRLMGPRLVMREVGVRVWSETAFFGMVGDPRTIPEVGPARMAVDMKPVDSKSFTAFSELLPAARGIEVLRLRWRAQLCRAGAQTLYVAYDDLGKPVFTQWLMDGGELDRIRHPLLEGYPALAAGRLLFEAAYTFPSARRRGLASAGKARIMEIARDRGATSTLVYVESFNVASLRANAAVGAKPDHIRRQSVRFGRRSFSFLPVDEEHLRHWHEATGR